MAENDQAQPRTEEALKQDPASLGGISIELD
jgi:hypothetical protein